jgi:integrase
MSCHRPAGGSPTWCDPSELHGLTTDVVVQAGLEPDGKGPNDLLLTRPGGGQLHRSMFVRRTGWTEVGRGRTLHDLRHTAACEWTLQGVPLTTVQAWLGHGSIEVTARYLHHLGDSADRAALQLLNDAAARPTEPARSVSGVIPG